MDSEPQLSTSSREAFLKRFERSRWLPELTINYDCCDPFALLHDIPVALFELGKLPNSLVLTSEFIDLDDQQYERIDWFIVPVSLGFEDRNIFIHRKFLALKDGMFLGMKEGFWSAKQSIAALKEYISTMSTYRSRNHLIIDRVMESLDSKIRKELTVKFPFLAKPSTINDCSTIDDIVAIPFWYDDPKLWDGFYQLPRDYKIKACNRKAQIFSNNLMFASNIDLGINTP